MRRILASATLASIALAAAMLFTRPTQPPERPAFALQVGQTDGLWISRNDLRQLSDYDLQRLKVNLLSLLGADGPRIQKIDPGISAMDCRIVAQERLSDDQFLLTEECAWKGGRVERRPFYAFRKGDGPSQGWMYQLAKSDI
jgi:hypothetical protein